MDSPELKTPIKSVDELNKILTESLNQLNMSYSNPSEENAGDDYDNTICGDNDLRKMLSNVLRTLCFTRDYVGEDALPTLKNWCWYDAGKDIADYLGDDEWAIQFKIRTELYRTKDVRNIFKEGDWVICIEKNIGCSSVFDGEVGEYQPFSYLNDYDPTHFRLATASEIVMVQKKFFNFI